MPWMMWSMDLWYSSRRLCRSQSSSVSVHADPFRIGKSANGRHAYDLDITDLSLLRQPTAQSSKMLHQIRYRIWHHAWYQVWYAYTYGKQVELESLSWDMCHWNSAFPNLYLANWKILICWGALQKVCCRAGLCTREMQVLTPSEAYVCHKLAQDLLHRAHKQFQNLLSTPLSVHVNNLKILNVTPVDGGICSKLVP